MAEFAESRFIMRNGPVLRREVARRVARIAAAYPAVSIRLRSGDVEVSGDSADSIARLGWRRGADLGDALCQANFGSRLGRGYGVEMDEAAGFRYYKLAADQGSLEGLFGVAVCYENGEGVAVDLDEAWRLMNLARAAAQANGDPGDYTSDIHAALPRIKSKQGGGNVAMVMTGPDGTVRTF